MTVERLSECCRNLRAAFGGVGLLGVTVLVLVHGFCRTQSFPVRVHKHVPGNGHLSQTRIAGCRRRETQPAGGSAEP